MDLAMMAQVVAKFSKLENVAYFIKEFSLYLIFDISPFLYFYIFFWRMKPIISDVERSKKKTFVCT